MKTLFLDFDGVLTPFPDDKAVPFAKLPLFEKAVRPYLNEAQIVICSDWRHRYDISRLRSHFSEDVAARIVDVTGVERWRRELEILEYVHDHAIGEWIVVDDLVADFEDTQNLVACDRAEGLTLTQVAAIVEFLKERTRPDSLSFVNGEVSSE